MASESFLLGDYGARLRMIEQHLESVDDKITFLVTRETLRDAKERQTKLVLSTVGGLAGAALAFAADWLIR